MTSTIQPTMQILNRVQLNYLSRTNDDVVNGNEDQFNEKCNKSHNHKPDGCTERNLGEFYAPKEKKIKTLISEVRIHKPNNYYKDI